jgi:glycerophosphoryl diester phosphodiesterase
MRPQILAHRGCHRAAPENTLEAFAAAVELRFDGIETDVRLDRLGTPILFHNRALRDGRLIADLSRAEISDAVGYQVPELATALDAFPSPLWNIEIKTASAAAPTIDILRRFTRTRKLLISSFVHAAVARTVEALDVEGALLVCHAPRGAAVNRAALPRRIGTIVWDCETVDAAALDWASSEGLKNMIYGFATLAEHAQFLDLGVAALITDFPEAIERP